MKLIFFLLFLLKNGIHPAEGLDVLYLPQGVILKYFFHVYYYSYGKFCCKFYQSVCIPFVNNRGDVSTLYQGRIFIRNYDVEFEVIITNLTKMDAGRYRCGVSGVPATFEDFEVSDLKYLTGVTTAPFLPKSSIKPTVWSSSSPSTPIVSENDAETISRDSWKTSYMLAAVLSVLVFVVISMTLLVYRLKTRKKKSTDKSEIFGSPNTTLEQIYSMVEFKPHQDPSEIYANLQIHNTKDTNASSRCTVTVEEGVEYSTIMRTPA